MLHTTPSHNRDHWWRAAFSTSFIAAGRHGRGVQGTSAALRELHLPEEKIMRVTPKASKRTRTKADPAKLRARALKGWKTRRAKAKGK
jgi:hypothetical protein